MGRSKPCFSTIDVYSCADMDPHKVIEILNQELETVKIEYKFLDRDNDFKEITSS